MLLYWLKYKLWNYCLNFKPTLPSLLSDDGAGSSLFIFWLLATSVSSMPPPCPPSARGIDRIQFAICPAAAQPASGSPQKRQLAKVHSSGHRVAGLGSPPVSPLSPSRAVSVPGGAPPTSSPCSSSSRGTTPSKSYCLHDPLVFFFYPLSYRVKNFALNEQIFI